MSLREALVHSRNLVSIRLLQAIGIDYTRDYVPRFGLPGDRLPNNLTMALGTAVFTPLEMARGYATIANGGFMIDPYLITEVRDVVGKVLYAATPKHACLDRKSGVEGKSVSVRLDLGGRSIIKKKKKTNVKNL